MKKKKLKKRIKKLERKIQWLNDCERTLALRCDKLYQNDVKTKDDISKLKDNKCCEDNIEKLRSEVDCLRFELGALNDKYAILNLRTRMPYDEFAIKTPDQLSSKTCETCKYYPFYKEGGQDIPCMGCIAPELKMWKPKEDAD